MSALRPASASTSDLCEQRLICRHISNGIRMLMIFTSLLHIYPTTHVDKQDAYTYTYSILTQSGEGSVEQNDSISGNPVGESINFPTAIMSHVYFPLR